MYPLFDLIYLRNVFRKTLLQRRPYPTRTYPTTVALVIAKDVVIFLPHLRILALKMAGGVFQMEISSKKATTSRPRILRSCVSGFSAPACFGYFFKEEQVFGTKRAESPSGDENLREEENRTLKQGKKIFRKRSRWL